jgi:hypothetical protein
MFFPSEFQNVYIDYEEIPLFHNQKNDYKAKFYQHFRLPEEDEFKLEDILLFVPNVSASKVLSFSNWCGLYHYIEKENAKEFFLLTDESKPYFGKFTQETFYNCVNNGSIKCQEIASVLNYPDYY